MYNFTKRNKYVKHTSKESHGTPTHHHRSRRTPRHKTKKPQRLRLPRPHHTNSQKHELDETDPSSELMRDFMSLIASFSGRFYRLRGWKQQKELLKEAEKNIQEKEVKNNDKKEETQK